MGGIHMLKRRKMTGLIRAEPLARLQNVFCADHDSGVELLNGKTLLPIGGYFGKPGGLDLGVIFDRHHEQRGARLIPIRLSCIGAHDLDGSLNAIILQPDQ
jgi:hypothetical protein